MPKLDLKVTKEENPINPTKDERFFFGISWTKPRTEGEAFAVICLIVGFFAILTVGLIAIGSHH